MIWLNFSGDFNKTVEVPFPTCILLREGNSYGKVVFGLGPGSTANPYFAADPPEYRKCEKCLETPQGQAVSACYCF